MDDNISRSDTPTNVFRKGRGKNRKAKKAKLAYKCTNYVKVNTSTVQMFRDILLEKNRQNPCRLKTLMVSS